MKTNNVTRMLAAKGIPFDALEIPNEKLGALEVAEYLNIPPEDVYKTIVLKRGGKGKHILALVPASSSVDIKKAAAFLREKKIYVPSQKEAEEMTGLQAGGISPLALINHGFQVVVDQTAQERGRIVISAGEWGLQVRVGADDLVWLTSAKYADIAE